MAVPWAVCVVVIILSCKGCYSQPACGRSVINSRILGGEDAAAGSWPWHAAFDNQGRVFCQGSLINEQWVLTAAHCSVFNYLSGSVVRLGNQNLTGPNPNEVTRRVRGIFCHQNFDSYTLDNDICLLMLSSPVNFTNYIQPVCLASENSTFYDGLSSWVTGFGYTTGNLSARSNTLQEVNIPIIGNNKCNCYYHGSEYYSGISITENRLCAGSEDGSKNAFYNDDGAALVTKKDSVWVQSGIVSSPDGIGSKLPTFYTRVSTYQKWIRNTVNGTEPGFVSFSSPGNDSSLNYTCPISSPTTPTTTTTPDTIPIDPFPTTTTTTTPNTIPIDPFPTTTTTPNTIPIDPFPTTTTTTTPNTIPIDPFPTTTTTTTTPNTIPIDSFPTTTTTRPVTKQDGSIFGSGENLIPFTHFLSLFVLVVFLHFFVGSG